MHNKGEFTPPGAIMCHLYGRYCCQTSLPGERDLFEALADIKQHYAIDGARLVIRGFSREGKHVGNLQHTPQHVGCGRARCRLCRDGGILPRLRARKNSTAVVGAVFCIGGMIARRWLRTSANTKTVAYSGEIDGQKQAADIMIKYAKDEGIEIPHIIGPQTPHKYHPDSKPKIEEFVTDAVTAGREPFPKRVHLTTLLTQLPKGGLDCDHGMEKEWERADITAERNDGRESESGNEKRERVSC
jgi:hypothetical protein